MKLKIEEVALNKPIVTLTADTLAESEFQMARNDVQNSIALLKLRLNFLLILKINGVGNSRSSLISDGLLAVNNL